MKRKLIWIGGGALVLILIIVANVARSPGGRLVVQVSPVKEGSITSTVRAPGRVQPSTQVKLSAYVMGQIVRLAVREGDSVKRGQFLLQIDDTQYRAQVRESEATLEAARYNLKLAESSFERSDASLRRSLALFEQELVSPEESERVQTEASADRARLQARREEVKRAEATLQIAQDNLRKTRFDSPIDGTITQLNVEQGEIVVIGTMNNPGTVILTVADLGRMEVEADVDETDVATVRLGQKVTVRVDALPDSTLIGRVVEIANSPDIANVGSQEQETNFQVDVLLDEPPEILRPGMTADVEIETATKEDVLSVPIQAVVLRTEADLKPQAKGKRKRKSEKDVAAATSTQADSSSTEEIKGVFMLADDKVEFRRVTTGVASDTDLEVKGDLKKGDRVVTGPHKILRSLKPGQRVKVESEKKRGGNA